MEHRATVSVLIGLFFNCHFVKSDVALQCDRELCLNKPVQYYQCIASNGSILLTWRIRDENGNSLDTRSYTTSDDLQLYEPLALPIDDFSTDLSSTSPSIISNISFTVQSSINGYTIQCSDNGGNIRNCTINIADFPSAPNVTVSFSKNATIISWIALPTLCIAHYTVNSNTTNSTITTTDTSVTIPLDGLSAGVYCVSVAAVNRADRTGEYSEEDCFNLDVPPPPLLNIKETIDGILVSLTFSPLPIVPPVISANISFMPANSDFRSRLSYTIYPSTTELTQEVMDLKGGTLYNVTAFGVNAIGIGSATTSSIYISGTGTSSVVSVSPSVTSTSTTNNSNNNSAIVAGVLTLSLLPVIAATVLMAITIIIILYRYYYRSTRQKENRPNANTTDQSNKKNTDPAVFGHVQKTLGFQTKSEFQLKESEVKSFPVKDQNVIPCRGRKNNEQQHNEKSYFISQYSEIDWYDDSTNSEYDETSVSQMTRSTRKTTFIPKLSLVNTYNNVKTGVNFSKKLPPCPQTVVCTPICVINTTKNDEDIPQNFINSAYSCVTADDQPIYKRNDCS